MPSNIEDEDFYWTEVKVKLLLTLYLANIEDFRNSNRKRQVWQKIANELECTVDACDKKFRNLKCYYVNLLRRKRPQSNSSWTYFQIFQEIFGNDPTLLISNTKESSDYDEVEFDCSSDSDVVPTRGLKRSYLGNGVSNTKKLREVQLQCGGNFGSMLDKLIKQMDFSNKIQQDRNKLFEKYYSIITSDQIN